MATVSALPNALTAGDPAPAADAPRLHLESLNGLRGLACLAVVWLHCFDFTGRIPWPILHVGQFTLPIYRLTGYGSLGVDVFFGLSGFCLAYPFICRRETKWDWKRYFTRRARRILPTYWIAVLLFMAIHLAIVNANAQPWAATMLKCHTPEQFVLTLALVTYSLNTSFWTLPVEWRWYFILPLLLMLWRRNGLPAVWMMTLLLLGLSSIVFHPDYRYLRVVVGPLFSLLPIFVAGVHVAEICSGRPLRQWETRLIRYLPVLVLLSLVPIVFNPVDQEVEVAYWLMRGVSRMPFVFLIVLAAVKTAWVRDLCSTKWLQSVGAFSYSLYLIHAPLIQAIWLWLGPYHLSPPLHWFFFHGPVFALAVGAGYLFSLVAEKPFLVRMENKQIATPEQSYPTKSARIAA